MGVIFMSEFTEMAKVSDLKDGMMKKVSAGGHDYLVAQADGKYYCTNLRCPHRGGDLSQGTLEGTVIRCPLHHSQFDLKDGHVIHWGGLMGSQPIKMYEVKVDGDKILANLL